MDWEEQQQARVLAGQEAMVIIVGLVVLSDSTNCLGALNMH